MAIKRLKRLHFPSTFTLSITGSTLECYLKQGQGSPVGAFIDFLGSKLPSMILTSTLVDENKMAYESSFKLYILSEKGDGQLRGSSESVLGAVL